MIRAPADEPQLVRFETLASDEEVERTRRWVRALRMGCAGASEAQPCCVVTPLGLAQRAEIERVLAERGLDAWEAAPIADWASAATPIYAKTLDDERLRVALCYEALWRMASPLQLAELWTFADPAALGALTEAKHAIRAAIGVCRYRVSLPGITIATPGQVVQLHPVHVPDLAHLAEERCLLRQLVDRRAWRSP